MKWTVVPIVLVLSACQTGPSPVEVIEEPLTDPVLAILDGSRTGGNPGFFWDQPIGRPDPSVYGDSDLSLLPALAVEICEWDEDACVGGLVRRFTSEGDEVSGGDEEWERLGVLDPDTHPRFGVWWHAFEDDVQEGRVYRIRVKAGPIELGYADVDVVHAIDVWDHVDASQFLIPPWISWGDVKEGGRVCRPFQGNAINLDGPAVHDVEIDSCEIYNVWDGIQPDGHNVRIHHCYCDGSGDDMFNIPAGMHNVEIDHNIILNAFAGIGWQGNGGGPPAEHRGTKWVHHNVIDVSNWRRSGRDDPNGVGGMGPLNKFGGLGTEKCIGSHTASAQNSPDPWQIYNNTLIQSVPLWSSGNNTPYTHDAFVDPNVPHHVFNNIMIMTMDGYMFRGANVSNRSQVFDGNLYWRTAGTSVGLFQEIRSSAGSRNFANLAEFKASNLFDLSKDSYTQGWEASGVEADPQLNSQWRPSASSPAASGGVDLSSFGWPGVTSQRYRGALPPR